MMVYSVYDIVWYARVSWRKIRAYCSVPGNFFDRKCFIFIFYL
uniref:Uncharacterized protein n=1 Tax=Arundo donax TaxID=35708 RepID=A0A0A9BN45_ARUDO